MDKTPLAELLSDYRHIGVGSLPFADPAVAVDFILSHPDIVPFWPELPRRRSTELMVERALRAATPNWSGYYYEEVAGLFTFVETVYAADEVLPLIKGQVLGPLTYVSYALKQRGDFVADLRQATSVCIREIEAQALLLRPAAENLLFIIDEPALSRWPSLGPAVRKALLEAYSFLGVTVAQRGHYLGLHSCSTWNGDMINFPFDLLSFDALAQDPNSLIDPPAQARYLDAAARGIVVVPGIYPSVEPIDDEWRDTSALVQALWRGLNFSPLFSAQCGHAQASEQWLAELYDPRPEAEIIQFAEARRR